MRHGSPEQLSFEFEGGIRGALCADPTAPRGKDIFKQDLSRLEGEDYYGEQVFVNADGDKYVKALPAGDGIDRYILIEKKNVPEAVREKIEQLKKTAPDQSWTVLYNRVVPQEEDPDGPLDPMLR